jgi:Xaa-Pro aminopeptidase
LGTLELERVVWPKGRKYAGKDFDVLARKHLFEAGLDYKHGTGHGVGSMLCVHEGPQGVSRGVDTEFVEGMCVSDEPGFYQDGEFGIRVENVIMVVQHPKYEDRLMFENLTVAPYCRELMDLNIIQDEYLDHINKHHAKCRELLIPLLEDDNRAKIYVEKACAPIIR